MTLTEARQLRDSIRAAGLRCTVPLGYGPELYFIRVRTAKGERCFETRGEWAAYVREQNQRIIDFAASHGIDIRQRRSPIEIMIDRACGVEDV